MWKFSSDWLRLSRVIVVTKRKKKKRSQTQLNLISLRNFHSARIKKEPFSLLISHSYLQSRSLTLERRVERIHPSKEFENLSRSTLLKTFTNPLIKFFDKNLMGGFLWKGLNENPKKFSLMDTMKTLRKPLWKPLSLAV